MIAFFCLTRQSWKNRRFLFRFARHWYEFHGFCSRSCDCGTSKAHILNEAIKNGAPAQIQRISEIERHLCARVRANVTQTTKSFMKRGHIFPKMSHPPAGDDFSLCSFNFLW